MPRSAPQLTSSLIARKGEASPTTTIDNVPPMGPSKSANDAPSQAPTKELIALSLRLDPARYERLKIAGVKRRAKSQTILVEALDRWLEANGY